MRSKPSKGRFSVSVSKDYLTFSAAHFLTIPGHKCESIHGHNYVVTVVAEAEVDRATGFVIDFADVKRLLRPLIDALDHRVLVPTANPAIALQGEGELTMVNYRGARRFVFPTGQIALVPISDTTAELLAEHLCLAVVDGLVKEGHRLRRLQVDVEESPGQSGRFEMMTEGHEEDP